MIKIKRLKLSLAEINVLEFHNQLDQYIFDILHENNQKYFKYIMTTNSYIQFYDAFLWDSKTLTCNIELLKKILYNPLNRRLIMYYVLETPFICQN